MSTVLRTALRAALRTAGLGLALTGLACPRQAPPTPPTPSSAPDPGPPSLGPDAFVQATGRGKGEDEAYAAARAALAEAVLGDAGWAQTMTLDLHRRGEDLQAVVTRNGGVEVALGLSRARVSMVVSELANGEPEVSGPEIWREPLEAYLRAHLAAQACERRKALFSVECETGQTQEADAAVIRLLQGVVLSSAYPDGVPVDAQGQPRRDPAVFVLWDGVPVAGVPLRVEAPDPAALAQTRVPSDTQGRAELPLAPGAALPPLRVVVDTEALLGPHAQDVPAAEVRIEPRATGLQRWALVITPDAPRGAREATQAVRARMEAAGLGAPVSLTPRDTKDLRAAPPDRRGARVAALADATSGRVDLVLVLSCRTRFASRRGGGRVWYEAEGTLQAFDAWTGTVQAEASATVEADGVGDAGAETAARQRLAQTLAPKVIDALPR